jgi:hypothetical protein
MSIRRFCFYPLAVGMGARFFVPPITKPGEQVTSAKFLTPESQRCVGYGSPRAICDNPITCDAIRRAAKPHFQEVKDAWI